MNEKKLMSLEESLPFVRSGIIVLDKDNRQLIIANGLVQIRGCIHPWSDGYSLVPDPVEEAIDALILGLKEHGYNDIAKDEWFKPIRTAYLTEKAKWEKK